MNWNAHSKQVGRGAVQEYLPRRMHTVAYNLVCRCQPTIEPLQRAQNAAARLVFGLVPRDHITPALMQLHWLPVQFRIKFKNYVC